MSTPYSTQLLFSLMIWVIEFNTILCRKRIASATEGRFAIQIISQTEEQQGELNKGKSKVLPVGRRNQKE